MLRVRRQSCRLNRFPRPSNQSWRQHISCSRIWQSCRTASPDPTLDEITTLRVYWAPPGRALTRSSLACRPYTAPATLQCEDVTCSLHVRSMSTAVPGPNGAGHGTSPHPTGHRDSSPRSCNADMQHNPARRSGSLRPLSCSACLDFAGLFVGLKSRANPWHGRRARGTIERVHYRKGAVVMARSRRFARPSVHLLHYFSISNQSPIVPEHFC